MIILGIDPGIATLGYGVIEKDERGNCRAIDCGVVVTPKEEGLPVRLAMLEEGVKKILDKYRPDEVAMEELFFSKNITTGIAVAHARGVALLTCVKECGRLYEYTPMQIKQALTGYGRADKKQIQSVVTSLLHLKAVPKPDDAADALAIALCHASASRFGELFAVGNMTRAKGKNQNVTPLNAYQELMMSGARSSKKGSRSGKGFSSAGSADALQKATGLSGVTGVGRASTSLKLPTKTTTKTTVKTALKEETKQKSEGQVCVQVQKSLQRTNKEKEI
ncbi:MAG: crossover junction endodeoxyribonuclease RuvC [Clostridia bacterium]|nr:crossover junction endodeoxyribonuclease RuvC [Clostridia bacterium]